MLDRARWTAWISDTRKVLDAFEREVELRGGPPGELTGALTEEWANQWSEATSETLSNWFARWAEDRERRGLGCDEGRFRKWIAPRLGSRPVAVIRRDELEAWVEWIEGQVAAGELAGTTAWRVWTTLSSMMRDAWGARSKALRVRSDNPLRDVRPPERGRARVGTFLYPSEFLRLMLCSSVWLRTRRRVALALYLYPRASELAALRWSDIDLRTGRIHIHAGRRGGTKTGEQREFVAEPSGAALPPRRTRCKLDPCPQPDAPTPPDCPSTCAPGMMRFHPATVRTSPPMRSPPSQPRDARKSPGFRPRTSPGAFAHPTSRDIARRSSGESEKPPAEAGGK